MTIEINGNWHKGLAYDVHTLASTYIGPDEYGHDQFDTTYSEMGGLVKALKYQYDKSVIPQIIFLLEKIKGIEKFDFIIPVPSTKKSRPFQPVDEIALALGKIRGVEVITGFLEKKTGGTELKGVDDPEQRKKLLRDAIYIPSQKKDISGCDILLVDDLFRSGSTLSVATEILYQKIIDRASYRPPLHGGRSKLSPTPPNLPSGRGGV